jgi:fatty acid desaturase
MVLVQKILKERSNVMNFNFTKNIGMLLLAIWLILMGLAAFVPAIGGLGVVLSILAIAAGIFILIGR